VYSTTHTIQSIARVCLQRLILVLAAAAAAVGSFDIGHDAGVRSLARHTNGQTDCVNNSAVTHRSRVASSSSRRGLIDGVLTCPSLSRPPPLPRTEPGRSAM